MTCSVCNGEMWVCETHADEPWGGEGCRLCGGAGAPCPACNTPDDGSMPAFAPGTSIIWSALNPDETIQ